MAVADPLSVSCGVCGAVERAPCVAVSGRVMSGYHVTRISAAKRKAKGEGPPHSRPA